MNGLILIAAVAAQGFFRLGRFWPKAGQVVDVSEFSEAEWQVLSAEPALRIGPAPDAEPEAAAAETAGLVEAVKAAIGQLGAEDFQKDGKPKLEALKERLPEAKITAAIRDQVWAELLPKAD